MTAELSIKGIDKAELLAALYNASRPQGLGFLQPGANQAMSKAVAQKYLKHDTYFDYLQGRVMKIDLGGDTLRTALYDRDNGYGAAREAIAHLLLDAKV